VLTLVTKEAAMRTTIGVLSVSLLFAAAGPSPTPAGDKSEKVPEAANVGGNYSELLKVISVPQDETTFGKFCDYGYDSPTEWGGYKDLPPGFWVYVAPNWYIWKNSKKPQPQTRHFTVLDDFNELVGHDVWIQMESNVALSGRVTANGIQLLTVQLADSKNAKVLVNKSKVVYILVDELKSPQQIRGKQGR
jgi:hypothetical protein